jgi:NADPH:quinone reductase-like Zn-dependent oxidoreductase
MRAITLSQPAGLDQLKQVEWPDAPPPKVGEVTVRLRASSLNFHDLAVVTGKLPTADGRIPLSDGAGDIVAIGADVTGLAIGDLVVSLFFPKWLEGDPETGALSQVPGDSIHGYAREFVTVPHSWFTKAPMGYSAAEAATLTCAGLTAWRALVVNGKLKAGQSVLVMGSGGVSVFAIQFAKVMGARVIATSSNDAKLERLKALGADEVINYRSDPKWGKKVMELTEGNGLDHVVEVGGSGTLGQSIVAARNGGHIALVGVLSGYGGPINTAMIMSKQIKIQGLTVGSRAHQLDMINAIDAHKIVPIIDRHFHLDTLSDAFRYQESGGHFGKIVIDISGL